MSYTGKRPGNVNTDFLEAGGELANHDEITVDASGNITATAYYGDGSNLTGVSTASIFPFYKADGNSDTITITNNEVPFYKADGSQDNIGVA